MRKNQNLGEYLQMQGVSRRGFLKFCSATASLMALPPSAVAQVAEALATARRPSVIWLSFQECTGCTESLTRSHAPTVESLIFDAISLDYHHTLQAAAGHGVSNLDMLKEAAEHCFAIVAVGTCAAFGGLPNAQPNPTGAVSVSDIVKDKPIINVSGCPPIPVVITGVLAHFLTFGTIPELDALGRPAAFFGQNIHDRCYRRPFYERGEFAETFDDEGARKGWCLYKLGCKGPTTYNACATLKWNQGTGFPIQAGHGCIGCSEPQFWDKGGFYDPLSAGQWGTRDALLGAAAAGAALGVGSALAARARKKKALAEEEV
jgi:hydrogenase small subunit